MKAITYPIFLALTLCMPSLLSAIEPGAYPTLKTGDWEMSVSMAQMPMQMKSIYCVDEATQEKMLLQAQAESKCSEPKISKQGDTYYAEVKCSSGGVEIHSKSETVFVGDTELRMKATVSMTGQPPSSITSTAKYLGACKEGRKPGDMTLIGPDGKTINVGNLENLKNMQPKFDGMPQIK